MELIKFDDNEILEINNKDLVNLIEYKISREKDKNLILEMKFDITDSVLNIVSPETRKTEEQGLQEEM